MAFWTPQIGLSCRSGNFLLYACAQSLLLLIWFLDFYLGQMNVVDKSRRHQFLRAFHWIFMVVGLAAAIFPAIGVTLMQIIGVYHNCLCRTNIAAWRHWTDMPDVLLSTNNKIEIDQAELYWKPLGIAATVFLGVTCYIGWWYQRRSRYIFKRLVERLDTRLPVLQSSLYHQRQD